MAGIARVATMIVMVVFVAWFVFIPSDAGAGTETDKVELKTVKYADLVKAVRDQRGKVVVIDLWGDFCLPCKREFHHLVELHRQYADKGLVCMSVALDLPADKDKPEPPPGVRTFLQKQKAVFANYWLNEEPKVWQERWHIQGPPAVFVFDREGRRAGKFDSENPDKPLDYEDVKKLVHQLLALPS
jgi:thiol-disulfide isomerase/thioredoxin